jgi:hypothetical protein
MEIMKMNLKKFTVLTLLAALLGSPLVLNTASADDTTEAQQIEETEAKEPQPKTAWTAEIQKKYSLTPEQMKSLENSGLSGPQLAFAAEAAKASGKSIDEVLHMRTGDKMGWGEIAKKLGLPPGSLGKSVAALRHDVKANRKDAKMDAKHEQRAERKAEKMAEREERKKAHEERKMERKADREAARAARKEANGSKHEKH